MPQSALSLISTRKLWILSSILLWAIVGLALFSAYRRQPTDPPATLKTQEATISGHLVPEFSLTNASGETVTRDDLLGRPWIASFLFTQCTKDCPAIASRIEGLIKNFDESPVQFVTISVDPTRDTPAALKKYSEARGIDDDRWMFLTGSRKQIETVVMQVFLQPIEEVEDKETGRPDVLHSPRLILVNENGRVVDSYNALLDPDLAKLRRDLRNLSIGTADSSRQKTTDLNADEDVKKSDESRSTIDDPPKFVEDFALLSQNGKNVSKGDLLGKPWVASFIFTRCSFTCPTITLAMKNLSDELSEVDVRFVGITVDPKYDTPSILKKYAVAYDSDSDRHLFLTGGVEPVYRLITYGFRMYAEEVFGEKRLPGLEVAHTNRVVLVDAKGGIVDTYLATNDADMAKLKRVLQGRSSLGQSIFKVSTDLKIPPVQNTAPRTDRLGGNISNAPPVAGDCNWD